MEQIRDLILTIARSLVDEPDQVKLNMIEGASSYVFELSVSKKDTGRIIGKQGRNANAVRTVLAAVAAKAKKKITLEIIDCD